MKEYLEYNQITILEWEAMKKTIYFRVTFFRR